MSEPTRPEASSGEAKGLPTIDVREHGGKKDGVRQETNRRLFMQLQVFRVPAAPPGSSRPSPDEVARALGHRLRERGLAGVVYADAACPRSIGLLTWSEDPAHFVLRVRPLFAEGFLAGVELREPFTMFGRTYSTGHEPELEWALLGRPVANVMNGAYPWHVWYPLRRKGAFARLEPIEQSHILREHAALGMAYGQLELAHDIRLACHGIDAGDNEFVIGLVGPELHPLSHLVQAMRKTKQTSEFIEQMGPFFVGYVVDRSEGS